MNEKVYRVLDIKKACIHDTCVRLHQLSSSQSICSEEIYWIKSIVTSTCAFIGG